MKFLKPNNTYIFKKHIFLINLDDLDYKNKIKKIKVPKYKKKINFINVTKSLKRVDNYSNIYKILNVIFKKGQKITIFNILNNFNEDFFLSLKSINEEKYHDNKIFKDDFEGDLKNKTNNNLYNLKKLVFEKKFFFIFENLIPEIFNDFKLIFNIKEKKNIKNLKKLKRKPPQNQLIYLKKKKRLSFLIKTILVSLNKIKKKSFLNKFNDFFFKNIIFKEDFTLINKKKLIYSKILKNLKKK